MNTKVKMFFILIIVAAVAISSNFILGAPIGIDAVIQSINRINTAKELDTDAIKSEAAALENQMKTLNSDYGKLSEKLKKRQAEYMELLEEDPESLKTQLESSLMYTKVADECNKNGSALDKFYNIPVNGKDTYTITLVGTLEELNQTLEGLRKSLNSWNISIGNYSLRQNYDAYDLKRTYDDSTRLSWYDNKLVNAFGEIMDLDALYKSDDEDETNGENSDGNEDGEKRKSNIDYDSPEFKYTISSLNEVKLDEEGMKIEITASNSEYEKRISDLVKSYGAQLDVLDKSGYDAAVREDIRTKLDEQYAADLESLKTAKEAAATTIELKYQQKFERDKQAAANMIGRYEDTIEQLKKTLVDSSSIKYKLDLTMMYQ